MNNMEIQVVSILLINNGMPIETQLAYFIIYLIIPLKQEKNMKRKIHRFCVDHFYSSSIHG